MTRGAIYREIFRLGRDFAVLTGSSRYLVLRKPSGSSKSQDACEEAREKERSQESYNANEWDEEGSSCKRRVR